jgi:macrolide-specific efflux system membrane fusion protein
MPPKKSKKTRYFILAGLILVVLAGYFFMHKKSSTLPQNSTTVERRTIKETVELSGEVTAESYANLHFPAGGLVTYAPYKEGDEIAKFSTIASLDQRSLKKSLEKYLNLYAVQRNSFDQTVDDNDNSIPEGDLARELDRLLANNQYQLDNSVVDVELQDLAIKLSRLSSPLKGILVSSPITTPNVYVGITDSWYVVDPTSLTFTADLDESDLSLIEEGQPATIVLDAYPDWELKTSVKKVAYMSKLTTTGTIFEVTFPLSPEHVLDLRLGLNGNVSILRSTRENVLSIPIESVKETLDGTVVTVLEDGKPVEKQVKLGASDDRYYEVLEGLEDGQEIYYGK